MKLENLKFELTSGELVPSEKNDGKFNILITKVKVLDENGKYLKFAKLNEALLKTILKKTI